MFKRNTSLWLGHLFLGIFLFYSLTHLKQMNSFFGKVISGDQYFVSFNFLVNKNKYNIPLIEKLKKIDQVYDITEISSRSVKQNLKLQLEENAIALPETLSLDPVEIYQVKVSPFMKVEVLQMLRDKISSVFQTMDVMISPPVYPDILRKYNSISVMMMKWGTGFIVGFCLLLYLIFFYFSSIVLMKDVKIFFSIQREKYLELKFISLFVSIFLVILNILAFYGSEQILFVNLAWVFCHLLFALILYGLKSPKSIW